MPAFASFSKFATVLGTSSANSSSSTVPFAVSTIACLFGMPSPNGWLSCEQLPQGVRRGHRERARRPHAHRGGRTVGDFPNDDLAGSENLECEQMHVTRRSLPPWPQHLYPGRGIDRPIHSP